MFKTLALIVFFGQTLAQNQPTIQDMHNLRSEAVSEQESEQRTVQRPQQNFVIIQKPAPPPHIKCPPNEILTDCVTPCQPTCEFPHQLPCPQFSARTGLQNIETDIVIVKPPQKPHFHPSPCGPGCICAHGLVRNEFGQCIPKSHCAPLCKPHSHFEECGPRCQPTCEFAEPRGLSVCTHEKDKCVSGCFCDAGYVKDTKTGRCVRPKDCAQVCPENEHYSDVGFSCLPTCQHPIVDWHKCKHNYTIELPGCYCNQGFLRDWETKKCVRDYHCPPKKAVHCPAGEHWYDCKPCTPLCHDTKPVCTHQCHPGCDCAKGLVRDKKSGKCLPLCECPEFAHIHHKH